MPQLIFLVLAGAGAYVGIKWFAKNAERVGREFKRAKEDLVRKQSGEGPPPVEKDLGELERDPVTGEYRPRKS